MSQIILEEQASPSTPAANKIALYPKAGGGVYKTDDAGVETRLDPIQNASNTDIDTGTETVDSFADTLGEGVMWFYVVVDNDDPTNRRAGQIMAAWDATNDTIEYTESSTLDVGDTTDLALAVDMDSNTVRLRATAGSDNWQVRCQRMVL